MDTEKFSEMLGRIDERVKSIHDSLHEALDDIKKHDCRIHALEKWKYGIVLVSAFFATIASYIIPSILGFK